MCEARLEIRPPKVFTGLTIGALSVYGLVVAIPVLVAILVVSLRSLDVWTFLLPLLALTVATFFLPFGFGNPLVVRLVRSLPPPESQSADGFVVQLSLAPRLRAGWRALIEDADDIGWLRISGSGLSFQGDSISLSLPYSQIRQIQLQSSGWRGLFAYGARTTLGVSGLPNVSAIQFAERSSWILPVSRRKARTIHQALALAAKGSPPEKPQADGVAPTPGGPRNAKS